VHKASFCAKQSSGSPKYLYFAFLIHSKKNTHRVDINFRYVSRFSVCTAVMQFTETFLTQCTRTAWVHDIPWAGSNSCVIGYGDVGVSLLINLIAKHYPSGSIHVLTTLFGAQKYSCVFYKSMQ